jgi:hypothetical protein
VYILFHKHNIRRPEQKKKKKVNIQPQYQYYRKIIKTLVKKRRGEKKERKKSVCGGESEGKVE